MTTSRSDKWQTDDCSSGLHDYCNQCQCDCHGAQLTVEETIALYRVLEHQYVDYENQTAHRALNVLSEVVKRHEQLGPKGS